VSGPRRPAADGLELIVLGAGPAYSDVPGDLGSAFLVHGAGRHLLLDMGQGTFNPLAVAIDPSSLVAVAISHLHPDHFIDLVPLRHYLCRAEFQPSRRLRVIAPDGLAARLDALYDQPGFATGAFDLEAPVQGRVRLGPFGLEARRVRHYGESCAYRVDLDGDAGPGLVYSGDIGVADDLRPLIRPGDVLLCEATFGPGPVPPSMPHLDAPTVGRLARETGVSQLVIAHVRMGNDHGATLTAARERFGGPTYLARPGAWFRV
jgi:ribonuclease BN (tRNA processing enzyme)